MASSYILRNATTRPVELHLSGEVIVLPPRGTIELTEPDAAAIALEKRGVLTRHAPLPRTSTPVAESEEAVKASSVPPTASDSAAGIRSTKPPRKTRRVRHAKGETA